MHGYGDDKMDKGRGGETVFFIETKHGQCALLVEAFGKKVQCPLNNACGII